MNAKKGGGSVLDLLGELGGGTPVGSAAATAAAAAEFPKAKWSDIEVDPNQPRKEFNRADLEDLAESMKLLGILEPLVLRETGFKPPFTKKYVVLAGERRYHAAPIAELDEVPYVLRNDIAMENLFLAQMVENTQRQDLTDFEVAQGIRKILDEHPKVKKGELAKLLNRSAATISKLLGMLDEEIIDYCKEGLLRNSTDCSLFKGLTDEQKTALIEKVRAEGRPIGRPDFEEIKERAAQEASDQLYRERLEAAGQQRIDDASGTGPAAPAGEGGELQVEPGAIAPAADNGELQNGHANDQLDGTHAIDNGLSSEHGNASTAGDGALTAGDDTGAPAPGDPFAAAVGNGESNDLGANLGDSGNHASGFSHDGDMGDFGGNSFDGAAGNGSATSSGTSSSGEKSASKTCSIKLKVEDLERLIPHFVDKAEDKVDVRIENDIAIAIIENMGGTVPADPADYPATIRGLLA